MPDFDQQLSAIARIREACREHEEALYRARLDLARVTRELRRAVQGELVRDEERDGRLADLRQRAAEIQSRLAALGEADRRSDEWFARLAEQERLVTQLEERLRAARDESARADPHHEHRVSELRAARANAGEGLRRMREQESERRHARADGRAAMEGAREQLRGIQAELAAASSPAGADAGALRQRQQDLTATVERLRATVNGCGDDLGTAIGGLYGRDPHPRGPLAQLDDGIPFLLFPVRIETIFVPLDGRTELWVRIYPDDIEVHTHEATLTDREVTAGELYWTELVVAEHLRDERDAHRRAAWSHLVERLSGPRAAWVARQTKPADWDALAGSGATRTVLDLLRTADPTLFGTLRGLRPEAKTQAALDDALARNDPDAFRRLADAQRWGGRVNAAVRTQIAGFPQHDLTKTDAWTRAPRTRVLPDRFVLLLYDSETGAPREIPGALVPDTLYLGPDPLDEARGFATVDGTLTFAGAFDWMSNFNHAVEQGMGFRVSLTPAEARDGFARICVLGVMLSAYPAAGAALLEDLIDDHQFGPKGFTIVPQGTPTNNTERDGSGYSDNDRYNDLAFFTETDPAAFDPADPDPRRSRTDGRNLAEALGIAYTPLLTVRDADGTDSLEAIAMNTALFPSTLGYWLNTWMSPVIPPEVARRTREFFTRFVTGRGPVPAVRVGDQPYGVLVTSDLRRWRYPTRSPVGGLFVSIDRQTPFLDELRKLLTELDGRWRIMADALPFVGKPGADNSDVLLNLLGLHPASVEFYQRIGYSDEYLRNLDAFTNRGRYANELASLVTSFPPTARLELRQFGYERTIAEVARMRCMHVLWQHYVSRLDPPALVQAAPVSETERLAANYVEWLASAAGADAIIGEQFPGPPPSALLYLMLRNAVLLQLHRGAYDWLATRTEFDPALEASSSPTTLPGVRGSSPAVSKVELMRTPVSVAEPTHALASGSVADFIWRGFETVDAEAGFVTEQRDALHVLAGATSAALERALVEHLDCCQYRLDAWETGLFTERLHAQRRWGADDRRTGIYLGAFGWVEHLRPTPKVPVDLGDVPASLRPGDIAPILEEDDLLMEPGQVTGSKRGGFMHAPSINQASAAAILRNAHLSHADPARAEPFSVNLSSERVRRALFILQGMRNGQPVEALLGYQFERGLHDRTSESVARGDSPVLELNQFILPYRDAFPFQARELPQAGTGAPAESVPANSVVNGLTLSGATLSVANGYGLSAVLDASAMPDAIRGAAILAEQQTLGDTLDAVKDLLMAENAYQLVQGNFDRMGSVALAQKDARIPPELQVIDTPRGSRFTFTNRVALQFDDLDPALPASNPWSLMPLTPRAYAEPGLNFWLGTVIGRTPDKVRCEVFRVERGEDGTETEHDRHPVTLAELGIQPVDFVCLVAISPDATGGATELETRIASAYRRAHGIGDGATVRITFDPSVPAGETTFGRLFPLARRLRALISESRTLGARDFLPVAGAETPVAAADPANPDGYDADELRGRVQSAFTALAALADELCGPTAPSVDVVFLHDPEPPADDETFTGPLGAVFDKVEEARLELTDAALTVSILVSDAEILHATLQRIAGFGITDALPPETDLSAAPARASLLARAHRVARRLRQPTTGDGVLDRAGQLLAAAAATVAGDRVRLLAEAGGLLFGETMRLLPVFACDNDADLAAAAADRDQLLAHAVSSTPGATAESVVDEWLQGLARVRPRLHQWEVIRVLAEALNDVQLGLQPVQVPHRIKDSWLAVAFPATDPQASTGPFEITRDTLSIAVHGAEAFAPGVWHRGILVDDWSEEIPTEQEITGITFRYNQPNAAPPQAMLLAVTPEETGSWSWDDLAGTLVDTLARAKRRAVEPAQIEQQGLAWNAFAPALVSEFSTLWSADVSLDLMLMLQDVSSLHEFYAARGRS